MAQYTQSKGKVNANMNNSDSEEKGIVDMASYKQAEENHQASAFNQVMSQMNIAGRSAFDKHYEQLWEEASEGKKSLSIIACEIDFFEEYIDNYGQQGTCFMLLVIALALKNICETKGYFLAHYKKAEFTILLKDGNDEQADEVAECLRQAVAASRTEHKHSQIDEIVTLSIGISSIYPKSMQVLMQETKEALLRAKKAGRNQAAGNISDKIENPIIEPEAVLMPEEKSKKTKRNKMFTLETDGLFSPEGDEAYILDTDETLTFEADDFLTFDVDEEPISKRKQTFNFDPDELFRTQ